MTKSSLTMREPSPMYFCTSSLPETRMKVQSVWCATARASRVLPVPGGPYSSTPCNSHHLGLKMVPRTQARCHAQTLWLPDPQECDEAFMQHGKRCRCKFQVGTGRAQPDHTLQATAYLGLCHSKTLEQLWMLDRQLNDLHSTSHSDTVGEALCNAFLASSKLALCCGTFARHVQDPAWPSGSHQSWQVKLTSLISLICWSRPPIMS